MSIFRKLLIGILIFVLVCGIVLFFMTRKAAPSKIVYGMSFNTLYATELGLDWKETYDAILDDLHVKHLRLAAHWPMVEPLSHVYNFKELDYQIKRAGEVHADVILAVGKRLPRWPECHVPDWAKDLPKDQQQQEILDYMTTVINRYKNDPTITTWQIENEP